LCIHSLGSPFWPAKEGQPCLYMARFLHALRGIMRASCAVCVVSTPLRLLGDIVAERSLERLCDSAVQLIAFAGTPSESDPVLKDYHGFFRLKKLPWLNSLT